MKAALLVGFFIVVAAFLFTVAGEQPASVELKEPAVKTASFSGETCTREGCINRYYWWWVVSGKPASEFGKDYAVPCWLGCVNGK